MTRPRMVGTGSTRALAVALLIVAAGSAQAGLLVLDDSTRCGAANAANGITIGDVTGNLGGSTECWGTFDGNNSNLAGQIQIGSVVYNELAKQDTPGGLSGADIGLSVTPTGGALSGRWSYDPAKLDVDSFLVVLKAASKPGFGIWLFAGSHADSHAGSWSVAWDNNLSHLSIYAGPPGTQVPEPGPLALIGAGLLALGIARRKARR